MRIVIALSIVATCAVIGVPVLILTAKRRRREKLRRRGIKHYNSRRTVGN